MNDALKFGSHMLAEGHITASQLEVATSLQRQRPFLHLGEVLVLMGLLSEAELDAAMTRFYACRSQALGPALIDLDGLDGAPGLPPIEAATPRTLVDGRETVLLTSRSCLGLSHDPEVVEAAASATRRLGTGTGGAPAGSGKTEGHGALERDLAAFMGKDACMLFPTGYQSHLGAIAGFGGRGDVVFIDADAQPSLHDGARLSTADVRRFDRHDVDHLEVLLVGAGERGKLVAVDALDVVTGELADLPALVGLCKAHGATLLVDDSHGFGVLGMRGRGTAEYFRLLGEVDLVTLSFGTALGAQGGCVLGDRPLIEHLERHARPYRYSTTLPPGTVAAAHAALRRLARDPSLRHRLSRNVNFLREGLAELGLPLGPAGGPFLTVPLVDEDLALRFGHGLLQAGVMVETVIPPAALPGQACLRLSPMASHTLDDLRTALDAFGRVGADLGLFAPRSVEAVVIFASSPQGGEIACSK